jgi:protein-S-isoprenylcysteine O-methyltransferase Ste14
MANLLIFGLLSIPVIIISRRSLFNPKTHGFYRFLSWACILWLFASNYRFWFYDPFSTNQIISWTLLFVAIYPVIAGAIQLKRKGNSGKIREDQTLFQFEKTSTLVDTGIYKYIRHPLYVSLMILTWGIFLKNTTVFLFLISVLSTAFLYVTAILDEKECVQYFGKEYLEYRKRTKMFIPFLL